MTFAIALAALPALAADPATATTYLKQGLDHFAHQDYEAARAAFERAYQLEPVAGTLFNLALAELQSGHPLEALRHLRSYLQAPDALPDKRSVVRSKLIPRAEAQTARVQIDAPEGATIIVDGLTVGNAPLREAVDVGVGTHEVIATLPGQWTQSVRLTANQGEVVPAHFQVPESTVVPAPPPPVAPAAPAPSALDTRAPGGPPTAKVVTLLLGGSLALASGLVGVGFSIATQNDASNAASLRASLPSSSACTKAPRPAACAPLAQDNVDGERNYWTSVGFYVAGGVLAASTVATLFLWRNHGPRSVWVVVPTFDTRSATATLSTTF